MCPKMCTRKRSACSPKRSTVLWHGDHRDQQLESGGGHQPLGTAEAGRVSAAVLRALHVPGKPLVLPNAWDVDTAKLVEAAGFPIVATSSVAVAAALGYPDGDKAPYE